MAAGNTSGTIVVRATLLMLGAWIIGRFIGSIAQRTVDEHIEDYRKQNPVPTQDMGLSETRTGQPQSVDVEASPDVTSPSGAGTAEAA